MTHVEVSELLHASPLTVNRWADEGHLTAVRSTGGQRRFPRAPLMEMLGSLEPVVHDPRAEHVQLPAGVGLLVPTTLVAGLFQVSTRSVNDWVEKGHLRPVPLPWRRGWLFRSCDVAALLQTYPIPAGAVLLTMNEAAQRTGQHPATISLWTVAGHLPVVASPLGRARYDDRQVTRLLGGKRISVKAALLSRVKAMALLGLPLSAASRLIRDGYLCPVELPNETLFVEADVKELARRYAAPPADKVCTSSQAAERLGVSRTTVLWWAEQKRLIPVPALTYEKRFWRRDVERLYRARTGAG